MWLNKQVSLYSTHRDNTGKPATLRSILLNDFAKNMQTITELRKLNKTDPNYGVEKRRLKDQLQCYTPAALLASKASGYVSIIERSGVMQLDFDYGDIKEYDLEELKRSIFSLPFIGFCGLSCSGDGFYVLALIAEPEKLGDYAEHCFNVLQSVYGIRPDTSKGKKVENLRYLSYDANMLIREEPEPLRIVQFKTKPTMPKPTPGKRKVQFLNLNNKLLNEGLNRLQSVPVGSRFPTVQQVAYTLGGTKNPHYLESIKDVIKYSAQYAGEVEKYLKCADDCFNAGMAKPL